MSEPEVGDRRFVQLREGAEAEAKRAIFYESVRTPSMLMSIVPRSDKVDPVGKCKALD